MKKISRWRYPTISIILLLLPLALNACSVAQAFAPTTQVAADSYVAYTVQPGDTVGQIATRYHLTIEQIIDLNANQFPSLARDPSSLRAGWVLRLPRTAAQVTPDTNQADMIEAARVVSDGINNARAQKGLALLRSNTGLTRIANDRSADMIARDYFSHNDPQTGQEPLLRYLQANKFSYRYAGENIAEIKNDAGWVPPWLTVAARYNSTDLASQFVTGWLNSPEHRANILNPNYHRTGVALAVTADGRRIVATQAFSD